MCVCVGAVFCMNTQTVWIAAWVATATVAFPSFSSLSNQTESFASFVHWTPIKIGRDYYACGSSAGTYIPSSGQTVDGTFARFVKLNQTTLRWSMTQTYFLDKPRAAAHFSFEGQYFVLIPEAKTINAEVHMLVFNTTTGTFVLHDRITVGDPVNSIQVFEPPQTQGGGPNELFAYFSVLGNPGDPTLVQNRLYKLDNATKTFAQEDVYISDSSPNAAFLEIDTSLDYANLNLDPERYGCGSTAASAKLLVRVVNSKGADFSMATLAVFQVGCQNGAWLNLLSEVSNVAFNGLWDASFITVLDESLGKHRVFGIVSSKLDNSGYSTQSVVVELVGPGTLNLVATFPTDSGGGTHALVAVAGRRTPGTVLVAQYGSPDEDPISGRPPAVVHWNGTEFAVSQANGFMSPSRNWQVVTFTVESVGNFLLSANGVVDAPSGPDPDIAYARTFEISGVLFTAAPTLSPTLNPTMSPTLAPTVGPTLSPTLVPTASPTLTPTSTPTTNPSANPTVAPTFVPTEAPTTASAFEMMMKHFATQTLKAKQANQVSFLLWFAIALCAVFALLVFGCKVFGLNRGTVDYITIFQFVYSTVHVAVVCLFGISLWSFVDDQNGAIKPYAYASTISFLLASLVSCSAFCKVYIVEKRENLAFRKYCTKHSFFLLVCATCSLFRFDAILLFQTQLADNATDWFQVPLRTKLKQKLQKLGIVPLVLGNLAQIAIVSVLQRSVLGSWTLLNMLVVATSVVSLCSNLVVTSIRIHTCHESSLKKLRMGRKPGQLVDSEDAVEL